MHTYSTINVINARKIPDKILDSLQTSPELAPSFSSTFFMVVAGGDGAGVSNPGLNVCGSGLLVGGGGGGASVVLGIKRWLPVGHCGMLVVVSWVSANKYIVDVCRHLIKRKKLVISLILYDIAQYIYKCLIG